MQNDDEGADDESLEEDRQKQRGERRKKAERVTLAWLAKAMRVKLMTAAIVLCRSVCHCQLDRFKRYVLKISRELQTFQAQCSQNLTRALTVEGRTNMFQIGTDTRKLIQIRKNDKQVE